MTTAEKAYKAAGVDIEAGNRAVDLMRQAVESTYGPRVLRGIGAFGGMYDGCFEDMQSPVLVASTDSVGTKTMVAAALGRFDTIGQDLVNHCINDILVQGARPLFFLDYFASSHLVPEMVARVVEGCAVACREADCALLGGETAELPGVYQPHEFDLVGAIVGVVDREHVVDGRLVGVGDAVVGLASTGLHTNGYSLARRVLARFDWQTLLPTLGQTIGEALLAVHRSYLRHVATLWRGGVTVKAMAHITGGGLVDNVPRALPSGLTVDLRPANWAVPPIFRLIQQEGGISQEEMRHAFNMGIGLVIVVSPDEVGRTLELLNGGTLPGEAWHIGQVTAGRGVRFLDR